MSMTDVASRDARVLVQRNEEVIDPLLTKQLDREVPYSQSPQEQRPAYHAAEQK